MVDAAEGEIPNLVRPAKKPRLDGEAPRNSPTQVVAIAKVLDDDNLLREIIVRVSVPTTLVRAALVCKRWLGHVSDPKFLRRFRKLHRPRLLGYYITNGELLSPRFVPMLPQPPELAAVMRRLESYRFGAHMIVHCSNGSVFTKLVKAPRLAYGVHCPLCAEKGMHIIPPLPPAQDYSRKMFSAIVSKEEGSGLSYLYLLGESTGEAGKTMARVYLLQDGVWRMQTLVTCLRRLHFGPKAVLMDNNIYAPTSSGDEIIVLDLTASSFSTIQLPQGVKYHYFTSMLSRADDASSVYSSMLRSFNFVSRSTRRATGCWLIPFVCMRCLVLWGYQITHLTMKVLLMCR